MKNAVIAFQKAHGLRANGPRSATPCGPRSSPTGASTCARRAPSLPPRPRHRRRARRAGRDARNRAVPYSLLASTRRRTSAPTTTSASRPSAAASSTARATAAHRALRQRYINGAAPDDPRSASASRRRCCRRWRPRSAPAPRRRSWPAAHHHAEPLVALLAGPRVLDDLQPRCRCVALGPAATSTADAGRRLTNTRSRTSWLFHAPPLELSADARGNAAPSRRRRCAAAARRRAPRACSRRRAPSRSPRAARRPARATEAMSATRSAHEAALCGGAPWARGREERAYAGERRSLVDALAQQLDRVAVQHAHVVETVLLDLSSRPTPGVYVGGPRCPCRDRPAPSRRSRGRAEADLDDDGPPPKSVAVEPALGHGVPGEQGPQRLGLRRGDAPRRGWYVRISDIASTVGRGHDGVPPASLTARPVGTSLRTMRHEARPPASASTRGPRVPHRPGHLGRARCTRASTRCSSPTSTPTTSTPSCASRRAQLLAPRAGAGAGGRILREAAVPVEVGAPATR